MQLELQKQFDAQTLHTGQHYDENMSQVFFDELGIPRPEYQIDLGGSLPQGKQTAVMITEIEEVLAKEDFDAVLVYGDTNSTLAATIVATKEHIPIIHVEAGLRSYNREMPEEINRIVADNFAYLLFSPSESAVENLRKEGITENVYVTGDVMCDMLRLVENNMDNPETEEYYFATIHRPYNTDDGSRLLRILTTLNNLDRKVVLAIHPRTRSRISTFEISLDSLSNIQIIDPLGYIDSIAHQKYSNAVITDSGGMQKEAYMLGKRCITLRTETEWEETLNGGWNTLVFDNLDEISTIVKRPLGDYNKKLYGDGKAAVEITRIIEEKL